MEPLTVADLQAQHPDIDIVRLLTDPFPPGGRSPEAALWHGLGAIARIRLRAQIKESK